MSLIEGVGIIIFFVGAYGLVMRKNIILAILSLGIAEAGIVMFFLSIHFTAQSVPPIGTSLEIPADPVVQAFMITAIVIGIAVTAFAISLFIGVYRQYGTTHWDKAYRARIKEDQECL